jgi:choice-of-anchor C domain-containing protein
MKHKLYSELCGKLGKILGLLTGAALTLGSGGAHANLITNGSFEDGASVGGSFSTLTAGSTALTGWTIDWGQIDHIGTYWTPSQGARSLDLNGLVPGSISQSFTTTSGTPYEIKFDLAGNPDFAGTKTLLVWGDGASVFNQVFTFDSTGKSTSNMGWVTESLTFTGGAGSTTLHFTSLTFFPVTGPGPAYGPALDNVSVTAVPLPPSLRLLGGSLVGLVAISRRKLR